MNQIHQEEAYNDPSRWNKSFKSLEDFWWNNTKPHLENFEKHYHRRNEKDEREISSYLPFARDRDEIEKHAKQITEILGVADLESNWSFPKKDALSAIERVAVSMCCAAWSSSDKLMVINGDDLYYFVKSRTDSDLSYNFDFTKEAVRDSICSDQRLFFLSLSGS